MEDFRTKKEKFFHSKENPSDPERIKEEIATMRPQVIAWCKSILNHEKQYLVDDLVSDIMLEAIKSAHTYHGPAPLEAWLYAIASHSIFRAIRKEKNSPTGFNSIGIENLEFKEAKKHEALLATDGRREIVDAKIETLSPRDQSLIRLWLQEIDYRTISAKLKMPVASIGPTLDRIKKRLSEEIKNKR